MIASWPEVDSARQDEQIERRFAEFQDMLGALREIRSSQNIPPKGEVKFCVRCDDATAALLHPLEPYFASMAGAAAVAWGPSVEAPRTHAAVSLPLGEVFVDLKGFIDVAAEIERNEKLQQKLQTLIGGKEKKLANANFVERAPAEVVAREREGLDQLKEQLATVQAALQNLRALEDEGT
jgi:valyl-tRNA synthetase